MIVFYKVTYSRLDIDDYQVFGYQSFNKANDKFDELLESISKSNIPFEKYVIRLSEVHVGDNGFYDDRVLELN